MAYNLGYSENQYAQAESLAHQDQVRKQDEINHKTQHGFFQAAVNDFGNIVATVFGGPAGFILGGTRTALTPLSGAPTPQAPYIAPAFINYTSPNMTGPTEVPLTLPSLSAGSPANFPIVVPPLLTGTVSPRITDPINFPSWVDNLKQTFSPIFHAPSTPQNTPSDTAGRLPATTAPPPTISPVVPILAVAGLWLLRRIL